MSGRPCLRSGKDSRRASHSRYRPYAARAGAALSRQTVRHRVGSGAVRSLSTRCVRDSVPGTNSFRARRQRDPARTERLPIARGVWTTIAEMGFNVVYLPPIHPIGRIVPQRDATTRRKRSRAIAEVRGPSVRPKADTRRFTASWARLRISRISSSKARELELSVALDIAFQVAPDHPYVSEARDRGSRSGPDGTIQYAENPPKKYQDIYPIRF